MSQAEFEELITDNTKRIAGDIDWQQDEDHSPSVEFRADVVSDAGYPLVIRGSFNPLALALSFTMIHKSSGRIYALDLGKDHRNPDGTLVGEKHKHRWREGLRDKEAYVPPDITGPVHDPVAVWNQFCQEALIQHDGKLRPPPPIQEGLL